VGRGIRAVQTNPQPPGIHPLRKNLSPALQ
jgi:hypothetical protein